MEGDGSLCSLYGSSYVVSDESCWEAIKRISSDGSREASAFYHLNVDEVVRRVKMWRLKLPRVEPHYAVKCNDDPAVLHTLALLGTGFDCASRSEMSKVLAMGVDSSRIIYAHPCKVLGHLKYARNNSIPLMTFDSANELAKIKKWYPEAQLLLRIRCDDESAQCQLGMKFGVEPIEARELLRTAAKLELAVVGVAFHVGSGCANPTIFERAISLSKQVFIEAAEEGHSPTLLDIGGGFLGGKQDCLDDAASIINHALDVHFPEDSGVRVIAEPGRFFAAAAFTLATPIINKRETNVPARELPQSVLDALADQGHDTSDTVPTNMLYIDDGVYGSFNCVLYDHQVVKPIPLLSADMGPQQVSSVWGPTCDGLDQVQSAVLLPAGMQSGDWLVWQDMGAYTLSAAGQFNGFSLPEVQVHLSLHTRELLEDLLQQSRVIDSGYCSSGFCSEDDSSQQRVLRQLLPLERRCNTSSGASYARAQEAADCGAY